LISKSKSVIFENLFWACNFDLWKQLRMYIIKTIYVLSRGTPKGKIHRRFKILHLQLYYVIRQKWQFYCHVDSIHRTFFLWTWFVHVYWNIISSILPFNFRKKTNVYLRRLEHYIKYSCLLFLTQKESTMNRIHVTIELPFLSDNII
jgi:hypothetical protein